MILKVKAHPKSKKRMLKKISNTEVEVWIHEEPIEGKANKAIIELLSEELEIPKSLISIKSGSASKQKSFEIQGKPKMPRDLFG
ncbi:MAG: DUF167 domain-containing protein [Patescibacteria group bacterium]